jgi:hypothetical protein
MIPIPKGEAMASRGERKKPTKGALQAGEVVLDVKDLKTAFGDRLDIACLRSEIIPGAKGASVMIPQNEPCPVNPHNHDGVAAAKFFQKVMVIKF